MDLCSFFFRRGKIRESVEKLVPSSSISPSLVSSHSPTDDDVLAIHIMHATRNKKRVVEVVPLGYTVHYLYVCATVMI